MRSAIRRVASSNLGFCVMEPATPLVLTTEQHAMIGELVEIMGQVDDIMIQTVGRLLNVDRAAAGKIMGSTRVEDNSAIWAHAIRNRISDTAIAELIAVAQKEIRDIAELRNDFIHALFTGDYAAPGYFEPGIQTTSATRIKSGKTRSTSEIEAARNRAATLSCLVSHIDARMKAGGGHGPSPWLERLGPLLQAHQPPHQSTRQEKGRKPPREPSRG